MKERHSFRTRIHDRSSRTGLFALRVVLDDREDALDDRSLVLEAALVAQHTTQEREQNAVLPRELETQRPDTQYEYRVQYTSSTVHTV